MFRPPKQKANVAVENVSAALIRGIIKKIGIGASHITHQTGCRPVP